MCCSQVPQIKVSGFYVNSIDDITKKMRKGGLAVVADRTAMASFREAAPASMGGGPLVFEIIALSCVKPPKKVVQSLAAQCTVRGAGHWGVEL